MEALIPLELSSLPSTFTLCTTLFLLLCIWSYGKMNFGRQANLLNKFPHHQMYPFIGSVYRTLPRQPEDFTEIVTQTIEELGRRYLFRIGHKPIVGLAEADSFQKVLSSTTNIEKASNYKQFRWMFGDGLVTSKANIWRDDRKLLNPFFKYQRFDGFLSIFNKYSKTLVDILGTNVGKEVNLHPILCRATLDFIFESSSGQASNFQFELDSQFFEAVHTTLHLFLTYSRKPYVTTPIIKHLLGLQKKEDMCTEAIMGLLSEVIQSRKAHLKETIEHPESEHVKEGSIPFIDALIPTKSNEDMIAHVITLFGAGFETTASGMTYTLFLLALHPEIQARVHSELDAVIGRYKEGDVTFGDLAELKYLEMCIKESMRIYPPVPIIGRRTVEDVELDGLTIPADVDVVFYIYNLHRDPKHFPDPERFNPQRFSPENCIGRHPYAYVPFSLGPRNCLGMKYAMIQMKVALSHILRVFSVSTKHKPEELKLILGMVLEPTKPIEMTLTRRINVDL